MCVYVAVSLYGFVALLGISLGIKYDWQRPWALASLCCFFMLGWLYVILHFATHTVAFIKVFLGAEGKWEVTARSIKGTSPLVKLPTGPAQLPPATDSSTGEGGSSWWRWKVPGVSPPPAPLAEPLLGASISEQQQVV